MKKKSKEQYAKRKGGEKIEMTESGEKEKESKKKENKSEEDKD